MAETAGGLNMGTAYAAVRLDLAGLRTDIQQARNIVQQGVAGVGDGIRGIGQAFENAGSALAPLSLGLGAIGVTSLNVAGDFQQLVNQIGVFGNVSGADLERVRQAALQMGADTMFSSSDAAAGLLDMMKAGMSVEEALAAIRPTLDLAAAGSISLAQASGIVTSSLAQFGLRSEDAARVSNALARAANASRADVNGLGMALGNVGPIAAQMGLTFEDTAAVLGVFANNGIMGAEAGTQLRSMLMNMTENTIATRSAWEELGLSMYDSQGNMRDFNTVMVELDAALDGLPLQDQNRLMQTLGGSYGVVGLTALRSAGGIDSMREAMAQSADAATVGDAIMQGFNGQMESLRGSVEALRIEAFTPFMEQVLTPFIGQVIEAVNAVTAWARANPELVQQILRIGSAITAAAPILFALGRAIALIASPISWVVAGLGALYVAFETNFLGIRDLLEPIIEDVVQGVQGIIGSFERWQINLEEGGISQALGSVFANIMQMFGATEEGSFRFASGMVENIQTGLSELVTAAQPAVSEFQALIGDLGTFLGDLWTTVQPSLQALANWFVQDALPSAFAFVRDVALPALGEFIAGLRNVWQQTAPYLIGLADWFVNTALPGVIAFVRDTAIPRIQAFIDVLAGIWEDVSESLGNVYTWFVEDALPAIREFIDTEVTPAIEYWRDVIEGIWIAVQPGLNSLNEWFSTSALPGIITKVGEFQTTWGDLQTSLTNLWTSVQPHLENIRAGMNDIFGRIATAIRPVADAISGLIASTQNLLNALARVGGWTPPPSPVTPSPTFRIAPGAQGMPIGYANPFDNSRRPVSGMRDFGGRGLPGQSYLIGKNAQPELFMPDTPGTFVPNADRLMGESVQIGTLVIHADTPEAGRAAADAFEQRMKELKRSRG